MTILSQGPMPKTRWLPLVLIALLTLVSLMISVIALVSGWLTIFQNLFYFPIILACMYYAKWGFAFSVILACSYSLLMLIFSQDPLVLQGAAIRVLIFILVAWVTTYLSIVRTRAENALKQACDELEQHVAERTEELEQANENLRVNITERGRAEKESVLKGMLLDAAADSIIVSDLAGRIVFANRAAEALRGYAGGELIGQDLHKLTTPEYAQLLNGRVAKIEQEGELTYESAHFRHDGTSFPIEVHACLVEVDGQKLILQTARDITKRKQAEQALQASDALLQAAVSILPVGLWIISAEGKIVVSSAAAQRIWAGVHYVGIDHLGEYKGWRTDSGKLIEAHEWAGARALEKGETSIEEEVEIECFDGTHKIILDSALPLRRSDGSIGGAVTINQDVTERKRAEEKLLIKNLVFEGSIAAMSTADNQGDIDNVNEAFVKLWGYKNVEGAIGKSVASFFADPADAGPVMESLNSTGRWEGEFLAKRVNGETFIAIGLATVLRDRSGKQIGYQSSNLDVTSERQAEEEIRALNADLDLRVRQRTAELTAARNELRIILDSVPAWVFYKDTENRFVRVNQVFADVMGMTKMQLEGKSMADLFPVDQADAYGADDRQVIASGEPRRGIIEPVLSPAGKLWVRTDKIPYRDSHGDIVGILAFTEDITKQKMAEDNLRLRSAQLEAANKELEAFSYSVSHDLRSPLRSIDGFSQAFLEDYGATIPEEGRADVERVRRATQRMGQLIDDMLLLSRVTLSQLHVEETDMSALAAEVAGELAQENPQRDVQLSIEPGMTAMGDRKLLGIVLANLLGNAWKFTSKHEHAHVSIGTVNDPEHGPAFFVRDDGAGFDPRHKDKLFVPFQRLHSLEEFPGTGIGLATVERVVRRHGGDTWAEGEVNQGATFYFTIPELPPSIPTKEERP